MTNNPQTNHPATYLAVGAGRPVETTMEETSMSLAPECATSAQLVPSMIEQHTETGAFWLADADSVAEPPWCVMPHGDTDHPEDRRHASELLLQFKPVLLEAVRAKFPNDDGTHDTDEVVLFVEIAQSFRESAPRIGLHTDLTGGEVGKGLDFTVAEAEQVGRALLAAVQIARGGAQ